MILNTSSLHDIGKIAIPDSILLKPGKLDPEEVEIMKSHTTIGAKILSGSKSAFLNMAEIIALTHHERFDGSGYPYGLRGDAVPLEAYIVGCAEDLDETLVQTAAVFRPDRWSTFLKSAAGRHHPRVVEALHAARADLSPLYD